MIAIIAVIAINAIIQKLSTSQEPRGGAAASLSIFRRRSG